METIDKLAWIYIQDRKVMFARSRGKEKYFAPGGKREEGETDEQALVREIQEELSITLVPNSISHLHTVVAQAFGKPEGTMVQIKCFTAQFEGEITPANEIEEVAWFSSADIPHMTEPGKLILTFLKEQNLID